MGIMAQSFIECLLRPIKNTAVKHLFQAIISLARVSTSQVDITVDTQTLLWRSTDMSESKRACNCVGCIKSKYSLSPLVIPDTLSGTVCFYWPLQPRLSAVPYSTHIIINLLIYEFWYMYPFMDIHYNLLATIGRITGVKSIIHSTWSSSKGLQTPKGKRACNCHTILSAYSKTQTRQPRDYLIIVTAAVWTSLCIQRISTGPYMQQKHAAACKCMCELQGMHLCGGEWRKRNKSHAL